MSEKVRVFVGKEEEKDSIDDGYFWRKYGQKEIHGSKNPRGYFRCTHRFTQKCFAQKQVQKSDTDPSLVEVKYLGDHTCNSNKSLQTITTNFSQGNKVLATEQLEGIKLMKTEPTKSEELVISLDDLEFENNILRTFSFSDHEIENVIGWESNIFLEDVIGELSPGTSGSGISNDIVYDAPIFVENSESVDSYFSALDNIVDFGPDWLWS